MTSRLLLVLLAAWTVAQAPVVPHPSDLPMATYLGNCNTDEAQAVAVAPSGDLWVAGLTLNDTFLQAPPPYVFGPGGKSDVFVARLPANGSRILFLAILGGSEVESVSGIALTSSGDVVVAGTTRSSDFPVTVNALQPGLKGGSDGFVFRLAPANSTLVSSTYMGGKEDDTLNDMVLDSAGNAVIGGTTRSPDFPVTPGAFDLRYSGNGPDGFVASLSTDRAQLIYGTYFGGGWGNSVDAVAVDSAGRPTISGWTFSPDFPVTANSWDRSYNGGSDAFIARLSVDGRQLIWSGFLGGGEREHANAITLDPSSNAYIAGETNSTDFPVSANALQKRPRDGNEIFIARIGASGSHIDYATYLGGNSLDIPTSIYADVVGRAFVTGSTYSTDFPVSRHTFQAALSWYDDGFFAVLSTYGDALLYSTYVGGDGVDRFSDLAPAGSSTFALTGHNSNLTFPVTPGTMAPCNSSMGDGIAVRIAPPLLSWVDAAYMPLPRTGDLYEVNYENMPPAAKLTASVVGAARFANGTETYTVGLPSSAGRVALALAPRQRARTGETFTVSIMVGDVTLTGSGRIVDQVYLPLTQ